MLYKNISASIDSQENTGKLPMDPCQLTWDKVGDLGFPGSSAVLLCELLQGERSLGFQVPGCGAEGLSDWEDPSQGS